MSQSKQTKSLPGKKVRDSESVMTEMVLPSHTNSLGGIFGGVLLSWIDICAAITAQRHSNKIVVTASIDELDFVAPVKVGWVVNLKSRVNFVGRSSMEIGVRVDAENPRTGEAFHTASAYVSFVALDDSGRPSSVPPLLLEAEEDLRRNHEAKLRRELRLARVK